VALSGEDRRRANLSRALLELAGLSRAIYRDTFGTDVLDDVPQLDLLAYAALAEIDADTIRLTEAGIERADVIGPWLYTAKVNLRMESFAWR
jgi:oxygen-independent coproporphyrinogen III oxidase